MSNSAYFQINDDLVYWLIIQQNHFIAIAHNMKAYDGFLIVNDILKNLTYPAIISTPTKIIQIKFSNKTKSNRFI